MFRTCVFTLIVLFVGLVRSFPWDIVVGGGKQLKFYYNGTLMHTEDIPSATLIHSITYDPVHNSVLFANFEDPGTSISSFDLSTRKIQLLVSRKHLNLVVVAYDTVTPLLFWKKNTNIYWSSIIPADLNEPINHAYIYELINSSIKDRNLLLTLNNTCRDIAVDSCGGYIYWITDYEIGRARFDGSEREVLIESFISRQSLAIDQQTQKMYWIEEMEKNEDYQISIEVADINGKNRRTFHTVKNEKIVNSLAVSKDFIYWKNYRQKTISRLPKHPEQHAEETVFSINSIFWYFESIAVNYSIKEQIQGNQNCETLKSLIPNNSEPDDTDASLLCVHGTKVNGEARCECMQGYTGDRCEISVCYNYCLQGDCSVSAEGQPTCSCIAGYYGERCEVIACHKLFKRRRLFPE